MNRHERRASEKSQAGFTVALNQAISDMEHQFMYGRADHTHASVWEVVPARRLAASEVVDYSTLEDWAQGEEESGNQYSSIVLKDESYESVYAVAVLKGYVQESMINVDEFVVGTPSGKVTVRRLL